MPWDANTGEERIDPSNYKRPVKPRPGYAGVFPAGPPAAPTGTPMASGPPAYERPGGGLFGLGGGAPPMPRSVPSGTPLPMPGPNPPGRQATPDELAAFTAAGGGRKPMPGVGFDPGIPRMPPVGAVPEAPGGVVPPAGQPETNWDRMQRENPELAAKIPGGGIAGGQRVDPREALLRQLLLG